VVVCLARVEATHRAGELMPGLRCLQSAGPLAIVPAYCQASRLSDRSSSILDGVKVAWFPYIFGFAVRMAELADAQDLGTRTNA